MKRQNTNLQVEVLHGPQDSKMRKLSLILGILILTTFISILVAGNTALSEATYCCEKTTDGAYCINAPAEMCNEEFKTSATSCATTAYCRLGTCYDSDEGICVENTPQNICEESGGLWDGRDSLEVPQCQLGCCIIADQAAFVPLVRCKKLSTFFGVENNYDTTITSEIQCIATAQSQDKGACSKGFLCLLVLIRIEGCCWLSLMFHKLGLLS